MLLRLVGVLLLFHAFPASAYAYIDPGTGSMVFQILIAGILGIIFTAKNWIGAIKSKIMRFFRFGSQSDEKDE